MSDVERAAVYVKLRKEYQEICQESRGMKEGILQYTESLESLIEDLRTQLEAVSLDRETVMEDTVMMFNRVQRYQDLLVRKADKRVRLEPFAEEFSPLES